MAQPITSGEVYNSLNIAKILKVLGEEFGKIEKEAIEIWQKVRARNSETILEEIEYNLEKVLNAEKPLLYLAEPKNRIWIEADRGLVRREYLNDVNRLLPPILAYFRDDFIIAYIPGTELKIHEVVIWDLSKKPKFACSCDNFNLIGNVRTIGTCAHVRMVLYWLSGSLKKLYDAKYNSPDVKDLNFVLKKEEELKKLLETIRESLKKGKYEKVEGGALWRIKLTNIFNGIIVSYNDIRNFLKEIYKFKEWFKDKKEYFKELEKELLANPSKSLNIR